MSDGEGGSRAIVKPFHPERKWAFSRDRQSHVLHQLADAASISASPAPFGAAGRLCGKRPTGRRSPVTESANAS